MLYTEQELIDLGVMAGDISSTEWIDRKDLPSFGPIMRLFGSMDEFRRRVRVERMITHDIELQVAEAIVPGMVRKRAHRYQDDPLGLYRMAEEIQKSFCYRIPIKLIKESVPSHMRRRKPFRGRCMELEDFMELQEHLLDWRAEDISFYYGCLPGVYHLASDLRVDGSFDLKALSDLVCTGLENFIGREKAAEVKKWEPRPLDLTFAEADAIHELVLSAYEDEEHPHQDDFFEFFQHPVRVANIYEELDRSVDMDRIASFVSGDMFPALLWITPEDYRRQEHEDLKPPTRSFYVQTKAAERLAHLDVYSAISAGLPDEAIMEAKKINRRQLTSYKTWLKRRKKQDAIPAIPKPAEVPDLCVELVADCLEDPDEDLIDSALRAAVLAYYELPDIDFTSKVEYIEEAVGRAVHGYDKDSLWSVIEGIPGGDLNDDVSVMDYGGLDQALKTLTPLEEKVLRKRFGFDGKEHTLAETSRELFVYVSRERIRQIESRALKKLRHITREKYLEPLR